MSSKYWMIKRGNTAMATTYANKRYIIGFPEKNIATRVAHNTPSYGINRLHRSMHDDIALDVKKSMIEMQLPISRVADSITIDVIARLYVPKISFINNTFDLSGLGGTSSAWIPSDVDVVGIQFQDFLMFPFEKHVGVVIPYEVEAENSEEYVFTCSVIDPTDFTDV